MLCYRCEHRAKYLETGSGPRYECSQTNESKCGCYMYRPVNPVVLKPAENDPRPFGSGMLACRSEFVRVFESELESFETEDGIVILCSENEKGKGEY